ncbi:GntR family transcriptional regulator [Mycolicibacterium stellerae]|uniref:GntR family transcriptional regulator n=1 Tax=Mycolicibacterium stellerae TaxID=2358193 RepID=UPI0013DDD0ED|nr:GntR family transcriptional regulator [Mycolicibacterium stellerae]
MSVGAKDAGTSRSKGTSLGETAYQALRHDIVHGILLPGTRLHLSERAKAEGVSLTIIREAAARVASEGLLDATPQRGFAVPELSIDDLSDLTWMRVHIETLALREAIVHGDLTWESNLVAAHHALGATTIVDDDGSYSRDWMKVHGEFHAALAAGCPHPRLLNIRRQLYDASELYRYWSGPGDASSSLIVREHKDIMDAALARDADTAVARLAQHFEGTAQRLAKRAAQFAK